MPIIKSAKKRVRSSARRHKRNLIAQAVYKTAAKKADAEGSADSLKAAYKAIDKATKRGVIHRNKAARMKSRLNKKVHPAAKSTD